MSDVYAADTADVVADAHDEGPSDASVPEAQDGDADGALVGFISFADLPKGYGSFYAAFDGNRFADDNNCQVMDFGSACVLYTCLPRPADAGPSPSAGVVTISGGMLDGGVAIDAQPPGEYVYLPAHPLFAPGDVLSVRASGGAVPAFADQRITGLAPIVVSQPPLDGGIFALQTSQDLTIAWNGGQSGAKATFEAYGYANGPPSPYLTAYCEFDATAGQATIPKAVLAPLSGATMGAVLWGHMVEAHFDAGAWSVNLSASNYVTARATFE